MLTFDKFTGINNVLPPERLKKTELTEAMNVDVGASLELRRRAGYVQLSDVCHKNLHQGDGFMLATADGDLIAVDGGTIYPGLGVDRVWYCNLPNGETAFSNGLINGVTDGTAYKEWGVSPPSSVGAAFDVPGQMDAGEYRYTLIYKRLSDDQESGSSAETSVTVTLGGVSIVGLPQQAGHDILIYLTPPNGGEFFYAGSTSTDSFNFVGKTSALISPLRTRFLTPPPVGTLLVMWRNRALIVRGAELWATLPHHLHLCDSSKDFKQFTAAITGVVGVADGLYVGTEDALYFLSGTEFDKLVLTKVADSGVALGSMVPVDGEYIRRGDAVGSGRAVICLCGGYVVAGFASGQVDVTTNQRYKHDASEVAATFRVIDGYPQYIAIPQ